MEERQIIEKIRRYLDGQNLPKEVNEIVENIYLDYEDAYKKYLASIGRIVENNQELSVMLNNILSYAKRDYEEDKYSTKELKELAFEAKRNNMKEKISNILISIFATEKSKKMKDDDSNKAEEQEKEDISLKRQMKFQRENKECVEEIRESVVSEIQSSKKSLIMKIEVNIAKGIREKAYIEHAKQVFENEVNLILNKAKLELPTIAKEKMDLFDEKIVADIIEIYRNERSVEIEKEHYIETQRDKFVGKLKAETNENVAIRNIQEKQIELDKNGQNLKEALPDNAIE